MYFPELNHCLVCTFCTMNVHHRLWFMYEYSDMLNNCAACLINF